MNINDIKAALALKAQSRNVTPVQPKTTVKPQERHNDAPKAETKATATKKPAQTSNNAPSRNTIENIIAQNLIAGTDYNTIPGCGRKPALLKAGAEKLAAIFNFHSTSRVINRIERYEQLFVLYEVQTTISDAEGHIIAEGLGSCNSKERKYLRTDFATNLNTILKMAKKRSYVDAVLTATHASGVFTQDIEDIGAELHPVQPAHKEA